jgi:hypothetical protein
LELTREIDNLKGVSFQIGKVARRERAKARFGGKKEKGLAQG